MRKPWLPAAVVVVWCVVLAGILWNWPVDGDDAYAHSIMAVEQVKCWQNGVIWPRFHPDWNGGTGSFLPSIYSPVVLSLDAGLLSITGEAGRAIGVSLVLALLAAALLMAAGRKKGMGAGGLLVVAPYLLLDIFGRATPTELWALAGVAGALPMLLPPGVETRQRGLLLLALIAFTVGCQPIMLILVFVPLIVVWLAAWAGNRWGLQWKYTTAWSVTGVVTSAIFWVPPLLLIDNFDRASIFGGAYGWRGHFATNVTGNAKLGPALLAIWVVLAITVVASVIVLRGSMTARERGVLLFTGACLVLASPLSLPLWQLPGLGLVQFPWRFLGPASVAVVLLLGHLPGKLRNLLGVVFLLPILLVPVELAAPFPALTADLSPRALQRACAIRWAIAPTLPMTPGESARGFRPLGSLAALRRQEAVVTRRSGGCRFPQVFEVQAKGTGEVRLPLQWWSEYVVRTEQGGMAYGNLDGLVGLHLQGSRHRVTVSLKPPRARGIGGLGTLIGLILAGILWFGRRWERSPDAG